MPSTVQGGTHDLIVETALELFAVDGYAGTSMRDIAERVGIRPASLYGHFSSKEELLWEVCRRTVDATSRILADVEDRARTPLERFALFFHSFVVFHAEQKREALIAHTQWRSLTSERRAAVKFHRERYHQTAVGYVRDIRDSGIVDVGDPEQMTRALLDLNIGVAAWYRPALHGPPTELAGDYVLMALAMMRFDTATPWPAGLSSLIGDTDPVPDPGQEQAISG